MTNRTWLEKLVMRATALYLVVVCVGLIVFFAWGTINLIARLCR